MPKITEAKMVIVATGRYLRVKSDTGTHEFLIPCGMTPSEGVSAALIEAKRVAAQWQKQATLLASVAEFIEAQASNKPETLYRVCYMEQGTGQYTGVSRDRAKAEEAFRRFRSYTRAWLQESTDGGKLWRTLDV